MDATPGGGRSQGDPGEAPRVAQARPGPMVGGCGVIARANLPSSTLRAETATPNAYGQAALRQHADGVTAGVTQVAWDPFAPVLFVAVGVARIPAMAMDGMFGIERTAGPLAVEKGTASLHGSVKAITLRFWQKRPFANAWTPRFPQRESGASPAEEFGATRHPLPRCSLARHTSGMRAVSVSPGRKRHQWHPPARLQC